MQYTQELTQTNTSRGFRRSEIKFLPYSFRHFMQFSY